MQISILIATKNRPDEIIACVQSILRSQLGSFEIIIVDQSNISLSSELFEKICHPKVLYLHQKRNGKSNALNLAIKKTRGEILAFTDDDCVVTRSWLKNIANTFATYRNVAAIFGKTLSYQPELHKNLRCPAVFQLPKSTYISQPTYHAKYIGFGNNMAIRASVLKKLGGFKDWLGPGSIGSNAEDAEMALRLLICGHGIMYNPKIVVYHNKWLSPKEIAYQQLSYDCGELACYGYFAAQKHRFAFPILRSHFHIFFTLLRNEKKVQFLFLNILYRIRGLLVGYIYSLTDPIAKHAEKLQ